MDSVAAPGSNRVPSGYCPFYSTIVHLVGETINNAAGRLYAAHLIGACFMVYHAQNEPEELITALLDSAPTALNVSDLRHLSGVLVVYQEFGCLSWPIFSGSETLKGCHICSLGFGLGVEASLPDMYLLGGSQLDFSQFRVQWGFPLENNFPQGTAQFRSPRMQIV